MIKNIFKIIPMPVLKHKFCNNCYFSVSTKNDVKKNSLLLKKFKTIIFQCFSLISSLFVSICLLFYFISCGGDTAIVHNMMSGNASSLLRKTASAVAGGLTVEAMHSASEMINVREDAVSKLNNNTAECQDKLVSIKQSTNSSNLSAKTEEFNNALHVGLATEEKLNRDFKIADSKTNNAPAKLIKIFGRGITAPQNIPARGLSDAIMDLEVPSKDPSLTFGFDASNPKEAISVDQWEAKAASVAPITTTTTNNSSAQGSSISVDISPTYNNNSRKTKVIKNIFTKKP